MKKDVLKKIITVASILTSLLSSESSYAAESKIDPRVINPKYTYIGGDVEAILKQRLQSKAVVMQEYVQGLVDIEDVGDDITTEARKGAPVVMPIHLGAQVFGQGGHWTGIAVFAKPGGKFVVFYNDPLGTAARKTLAARELIRDIKRAVGAANVEVIDLQIKQQSDGTSCGAYTAENLIALASLDPSKLNEAEARAALSKLTTNAKNIRWLHGGVINSFEELINSEVTLTQVGIVHTAALNDLSSLGSLTAHRLNDLYLASNIKGFNSGDDEAISYGAWVRGNLGNGNYKAKDSTKFKNKFNGATIGFDGKITEDLTVGLAVNVSSSNLKPKATSQNNNLGSNYNGVIGSVYGSFVDGDAVAYNLNLEGGKVNSKALYNSTVNGKNTIKFSGSVWKTSFDTSYYAQLGQVVLVPSIGISYEKAEFNKTKHVNFNIGKTYVERLTLTPGIKVTKSIDLGGVQVIPAAYASTNYSPLTESSKITVKSNNGFVLSEGAMPVVENSSNVGASITVASHNIEASLGYERIIQEKYQGQVGYVKLRINF